MSPDGHESITVTKLYHVVLVDYKPERKSDSKWSDVKAKEHHVPLDVLCIDPFSHFDAFQVFRLNVPAFEIVDLILG